MTPRNPAHIGPDGKGFFGTVTVGQRGQVALPAQARKQLGLEPGDQLVVLTDPAQGLALIPLRLLLERAPNDPLAMLVRSTLGGSAPTGPPPGGPAAPPAPPGEPSAGPAGAPPTASAPPAPPTTSAPTHQEQS